jgi:hypothetical protein
VSRRGVVVQVVTFRRVVNTNHDDDGGGGNYDKGVGIVGTLPMG